MFYRCNLAKFQGKQCDADIYLLNDSTSDEVILFWAIAEHSHDGNSSKNLFSEDVENIINELIKLRIKPKRNLEILHEQGKEMKKIPWIIQLRNFLTKLKKEKYEPAKISKGELEGILKENKNVP